MIEAAVPSSDVVQVVSLERVAGLTGSMQHSGVDWRFSGTCVDELVLGPTQLVFGSVVLSSTGTSRFRALRVQLDLGNDPVRVDLRVQRVVFEFLRIAVGSVVVSARLTLEGADLQIEHGRGCVRADRASFEELVLRVGDLELRSPRVSVRDMALGWGGGEGFWMRAVDAQAGKLSVKAEGLNCEARVVRLETFELGRGTLSTARLRVEELVAQWLRREEEVRIEPDPEEGSAARQRHSATRPVWDPRLLDGLRGQLAFDLHLDLRLAGLLTRRVMHQFRLDVVDGCIDFRALEKSLATLEDLLLDFSVRDDRLILELGLPLVPSRGHGKPLVVWHLEEPDRALAADNRVRLAVLARYEPCVGREGRASTQAERSSAAKPRDGYGLRLDAARWQWGSTQLNLSSVPCSGVGLREVTCAQARIEGDVTYLREGPPPAGGCTAAVDDLQVHLVGLRLGTCALSGRLTAASIDKLSLKTRGLAPREWATVVRELDVRSGLLSR